MEHENETIEENGVCDICNLDLKTPYDLQVHQKIAHAFLKSYKCSLCKFAGHTEKMLDLHLEKHSKGCKSQCDICYQLFSSKISLRRHIQYKHTYEKPWKCDHCPFAAVEVHKLNIHKMEHTGMLPYPCDYCEKRFRTKTNLRLHQTTHDGRRDCICILCFQLFKTNSLLKRHMRAAHSVESMHIVGICSIEKEGMPETLREFINRLCLEEKIVMEGKQFKYYELKADYKQKYSKHFKNVSSIITDMERRRDGEDETEDSGNVANLRGLRTRLFLGDLSAIPINEILPKIEGKKSYFKKVKDKVRPEEKCKTIKRRRTKKTKGDEDYIATESLKAEKFGDKNYADSTTGESIQAASENSQHGQIRDDADNIQDIDLSESINLENISVSENFMQVEDLPDETNNSTHKSLMPKEKNIPILVREDEDKEKRTMLLDKMKTGGFGPKPHVIKILPNGIIVDCTEKYRQYLLS